MKRAVINLDAHAGTQMAPEVLETIYEVMRESTGNSASSHLLGKRASEHVERSRREVARFLNAQVDEIVFTPGATEALNLAIQGWIRSWRRREPRLRAAIVTSPVEHLSLLGAAELCRKQFGAEIRLAKVDRSGLIQVDELASLASDAELSLVGISHANSEIGTVNPIEQTASMLSALEHVSLLVDSSQGAAYLPLDTQSLAANFVVISSHKMHGPQGVAALYIRRGTVVDPIIAGGGQERGLWPGTPNHSLIAGFGTAARLALASREERIKRVRVLADIFLQRLKAKVPDIVLNGHKEKRLPNNLNITVPNVPWKRIASQIDIAISSGSACSSRRREPSHVLRAIGLTDSQADSTFRAGFSVDLSESEVEDAACRIAEAIQQVRVG